MLKSGTTHYHANLGFLDKGCANKGLVVCNDLESHPFSLQKMLSQLRIYSNYNLGTKITKVTFTVTKTTKGTFLNLKGTERKCEKTPKEGILISKKVRFIIFIFF